jgi:hypothetical protein
VDGFVVDAGVLVNVQTIAALILVLASGAGKVTVNELPDPFENGVDPFRQAHVVK